MNAEKGVKRLVLVLSLFAAAAFVVPFDYVIEEVFGVDSRIIVLPAVLVPFLCVWIIYWLVNWIAGPLTKQTVILWVAIITIVIMCLAQLFSVRIELTFLFLQCFIVVLIAGGLIFTLRTKKPD